MESMKDYPSEKNGRKTKVRNPEKEGQLYPDELRTGQSQGTGEESRCVGVGIDRVDRTAETNTTIDTINGGILRRLKQSEQRRLAEARECLEWYKRQEEDAQAALAEIEALESLAKSQQRQE